MVFAKHRQADTLQMLDYGYAVNIIQIKWKKN